MKPALLILSLLMLAGCQSTKPPATTVIAPQIEGGEQPEIRCGKRGNVFYLELNRDE